MLSLDGRAKLYLEQTNVIYSIKSAKYKWLFIYKNKICQRTKRKHHHINIPDLGGAPQAAAVVPLTVLCEL
jgi:hypothetical protein